MISRRSLFGFALVPLAKPRAVGEVTGVCLNEIEWTSAMPPTLGQWLDEMGLAQKLSPGMKEMWDMEQARWFRAPHRRPVTLRKWLGIDAAARRDAECNTVTSRAQRQDSCQFVSTPNRQPSTSETQ